MYKERRMKNFKKLLQSVQNNSFKRCTHSTKPPAYPGRCTLPLAKFTAGYLDTVTFASGKLTHVGRRWPFTDDTLQVIPIGEQCNDTIEDVEEGGASNLDLHDIRSAYPLECESETPRKGLEINLRGTPGKPWLLPASIHVTGKYEGWKKGDIPQQTPNLYLYLNRKKILSITFSSKATNLQRFYNFNFPPPSSTSPHRTENLSGSSNTPRNDSCPPPSPFLSLPQLLLEDAKRFQSSGPTFGLPFDGIDDMEWLRK
ncbi:hypothetical protein LXL04_011501 [Taraxacum kok-saghyz]